MSHIVSGTVGKSRPQLDCGIPDNEEFRLDGEGQREDKQAVVGKQHAERQQNGVDRSRSTYGGHHVEVFFHGDNCRTDVYLCVMAQFRHILDVLHSFLDESCTDAAGDIVKQETFRSPGSFENRAEHENSEHIEEDVAEPAVHEHISDELRQVEVTCEEKMQS